MEVGDAAHTQGQVLLRTARHDVLWCNIEDCTRIRRVGCTTTHYGDVQLGPLPKDAYVLDKGDLFYDNAIPQEFLAQLHKYLTKL